MVVVKRARVIEHLECRNDGIGIGAHNDDSQIGVQFRQTRQVGKVMRANIHNDAGLAGGFETIAS